MTVGSATAEQAGSGSEPNAGAAVGRFGRRSRGRGRRTAGGTTRPAPGRVEPGAEQLHEQTRHPLVRVEAGQMGQVLDLDVHQRAPAQRRAPRPASAPPAGARRTSARVRSPSSPAGPAASWRTTRRRPRCGARRAPRRRRRAPPPARTPRPCSRAPAGWRRGGRARAITLRHAHAADAEHAARNSWSAPCGGHQKVNRSRAAAVKRHPASAAPA